MVYLTLSRICGHNLKLKMKLQRRPKTPEIKQSCRYSGLYIQYGGPC